jgi:hypothetical protein
MNVINFRLDKIQLLTKKQEVFCCLSEPGHRSRKYFAVFPYQAIVSLVKVFANSNIRCAADAKEFVAASGLDNLWCLDES